jgi:hypothetical protein
LGRKLFQPKYAFVEAVDGVEGDGALEDLLEDVRDELALVAEFKLIYDFSLFFIRTLDDYFFLLGMNPLADLPDHDFFDVFMLVFEFIQVGLDVLFPADGHDLNQRLYYLVVQLAQVQLDVHLEKRKDLVQDLYPEVVFTGDQS